MKILTVTATYPPSTNGIAISLGIQKPEIEKLGHTYTIICPRFPGVVSEPGVYRLRSLPNPFILDYPVMLPHFASRLAAALPGQYDLVFIHHPFTVGSLGLKLAKIYNCPTVFFYHTQYLSYFSRIPMASVFSGFMKNYLTNFLNSHEGIIVETLTTAKQLTDQHLRPPVRVIPTARNFQHQKYLPRPQLRQKYHLPQDKIIILCVCRMSAEKNLPMLIDAFARLSPQNSVHLCLTGSGPDLPNLKNYATRKGLANVTFTGNVPFVDIGEIYSLADIFAYPSSSDTQAIVLVEAMYHSLPLVGINASGPVDFITPGKNGILFSTGVELTTALQHLIDQPGISTQMGKASEIISRKYTIKNNTEQTLQFFNEIISRH